MPHVLVLSYSDLRSDPRVARQIDWLCEASYDVTAAGHAPPTRAGVPFHAISTEIHDSLPSKLLRGLRLVVRRHAAFYWARHRADWEALRKVRPDLIVANDLDTLPLAVRLAEDCGARVIFDAHEYSPREFDHSRKWRLLRGPHAKALCRKYTPRVAAFTTVGPGVAAAYAELTGIRPETITNAPSFQPELAPTLVNRDRIRLLHHGVATPARKIENMVRLADWLEPRFELHFILVGGDVSYREHLQQMAAASPRTHFHPAVPMTEIASHLNQYDLGVFLLEPTNFNYRHALPNKFFEFLQARLGIAIGPSHDMAEIVRATGAGIVSEDFQPESLAKTLNRLTAEDVTRFKHAAHSAAREYSAEANRVKWLEICRRALGD